MSPDQIAGSLLCICSIAFIAILTAYEAVLLTGRRDAKMRDEFGPLYRDQAGHQAWVDTGLTDYQPGDTPVFERMCLERLDSELES